MGWHVSYAMSTVEIIHKLESFSHHKDHFVTQLLQDSNREAIIQRRIQNCEDLFGRTAGDLYNASDALPTIPDMPANEHCPSAAVKVRLDGNVNRSHENDTEVRSAESAL